MTNTMPISADNPALMLLLVGGLSLLPMALLGMSSFIKISVVFNILRNALGVGQVPSGVVVTLLSLVLSLHIMSPVLQDIELIVSSELLDLNGQARSVRTEVSKNKTTAEKAEINYNRWLVLVRRAAIPLELFMKKHAGVRERLFFAQNRLAQISQTTPSRAGRESVSSELASSHSPNSQQTAEVSCETSQIGSNGFAPSCQIQEETFFSLLAAFMISELKQSFVVGFAVFLPFLVIDLIVANILMGLGLSLVNPLNLALPLKLILFVASDGWFFLAQGLILSYQ